MRILVTGGTGNVGRACVARLVRHGHQVKVIGRRADVQVPGASYASCDVTDFAALREQVRGMEGIVHLAAIPHPSGGPGQEIFRVNCQGTYNVYQAAAEEGIRRVVTASSINALGYNFGVVEFPLRYFPVDEEHPSYTTDAYSFSKQIVEEIAAYFWRREGISGVCLRLPAVYETGEGGSPWTWRFVVHMRRATAAFMALPEEERKERARQVYELFLRMRAERVNERPRDFRRRGPGSMPEDALIAMGRSNLWATVNAEDSAQAIEKGLTASYEGSHPLYINDSQNAVGVASEELAQTFFPEVMLRKVPLVGTDSLVSIERARQLIGFEPEHHAEELEALVAAQP